MRNTIQNFFNTTNIRVAGAKFCVALLMVFSPVLLRINDQNLDHLSLYFLCLFFISIPFFIQSFYQLGCAFRASPNKWVGVVLGCVLFGTIQASIALFILVLGSLLLIATLNFTIAAKVANTLLPYIKESFKLNPEVSKEKLSDIVEGSKITLSNAQDKEVAAIGVAAPVLGTTAIPENINDYASYLEGLTRK